MKMSVLLLVVLFPLFANAGDGGSGSSVKGGGEIFNPDSPSVYKKEDVENVAKNIEYLEYLFNRLDFEYYDLRPESPEELKEYLNSPIQRLFTAGIGDGVYAKLKNVKIELQEAPCLDPNSPHGHPVEKAASANGESGVDIICVSYGRLITDPEISKKQNLGQVMYSLMAHEMAHLVGLGEPDAQVIQESIFYQLGSKGYYKFGSWLNLKQKDLEKAIFALNSGVAAIKEANLPLACERFAFAREKFQSYEDDNFDWFLYRVTDMTLVRAIEYESFSQLDLVCRAYNPELSQERVDELLDFYTKIFSEKKELTLVELFESRIKNFGHEIKLTDEQKVSLEDMGRGYRISQINSLDNTDAVVHEIQNIIESITAINKRLELRKPKEHEVTYK